MRASSSVLQEAVLVPQYLFGFGDIVCEDVNRKSVGVGGEFHSVIAGGRSDFGRVNFSELEVRAGQLLEIQILLASQVEALLLLALAQVVCCELLLGAVAAEVAGIRKVLLRFF